MEIPYDQIFIIAGVVVSIVVGVFSIRNEIKKGQERQKQEINTAITSEVNKVITHIDEKTKVIDERFRTTETALSQNKEDVEDIEDDIKKMSIDLKDICEKLVKHDYVIDEVLPEYRLMREDFNRFKYSVDRNLFVKRDVVERNTDDDTGDNGKR